MIDWIKSFFGQGRVRAEWTGFDPTGKKVTGDAKAPYVGMWDETAMIDYIKQQLLYKHGIKVTDIKIITHIEE